VELDASAAVLAMAHGRRALLLLRSVAAQRQKAVATVLSAAALSLGLCLAARRAAAAKAAADAEAKEAEHRRTAAQLVAARECIASMEDTICDAASARDAAISERDAATARAAAAEQRFDALEEQMSAQQAAAREHIASVEVNLGNIAGALVAAEAGWDAEAARAALEERAASLEAEMAVQRAAAAEVGRWLRRSSEEAAQNERRVAVLMQQKDEAAAAARADAAAAREKV